ncbi:hypothetical protein Hanom_Chr16g01440431 [Helianthus anomalus]
MGILKFLKKNTIIKNPDKLSNTNDHKRTRYRTFTNTNERTRPLFMFVHLTKRQRFLDHFRSFIKRTNTNELPAKRFMECSLNVQFICNPTHKTYIRFSQAHKNVLIGHFI